MAERTSTSTTEISKLVATIRNDTDAAAKGMTVAREEMERGSKRVGEATKALAHINDSSREELRAVSESNTAMAEQKLASHSVAQSVERIARLSKTIATAPTPAPCYLQSSNVAPASSTA